jgi:RNA polymerase sigma-70 factor (ECF subfamily)
MTSQVRQSTSLWGTAVAPVDWEAVYVEQLPRVYNYLRYRTGNEAVAEELTSRTFEKAWRERLRYRAELAGVATWLLRIARNTAIDYRRTWRGHEPLDEEMAAAAESAPEETALVDSNFARLSLLVGALPERERELLALKYGAGATNRAIADVTGLSESNVGTILHRTVQKLRTEW